MVMLFHFIIFVLATINYMKTKFYFLILLFVVSSHCQAQNFGWARKMGNNNDDKGCSIAVDAASNVFTTGFLSVSPGWKDIFISKYDKIGNLIWVKQFGSIGAHDAGNSMTLDNKNNIYVTGYFNGTVDFDPGPGIYNKTSIGLGDIFVCKYDSLGNFIWALTFGGTGEDYGKSIVVNRNGDVFTLGQFKGIVDFDSGPGIYNKTSAGQEDVFISKVDSLGNFVWTKTFGGVNLDNGMSLTIDSVGNIYSTGYFYGPSDFDPGAGTFTLTSINNDTFISKLDSSGNFIWAKQFTGAGNEVGYSIKTSINTDIIISGVCGTTDFDPGPGTHYLYYIGGNFDAFVCKLDSSGNFKWVKQLGGSMSDYLYSMAIDTSGSIYSTGFFEGTADFDPGPGAFNLIGNGSHQSTFISKLDSLGNFVWAKALDPVGMYGYCFGNAVALDSEGNSYYTGNFAFTVDFDPGSGVYNLSYVPSGDDAFVLKILNPVCSNINLQVDSAIGISCLQPGYASVFSSGAKQPYTFSWNTTPPTNDSIAFFTTPGFYTLLLNDSVNCTLRRDVLINGPNSFVNFDLVANMRTIPAAFRISTPVNVILDGFNKGCYSISGYLAMVLPPSVVYNSSVPLPDNISGDTLFWNFTNLNYDDLHFTPLVNVTPSSALSFGDTICFDVFITPISGDADSLNNHQIHCFEVKNAIDPNIISVYPPGSCAENYVLNNQKLTYTIQFQNTGNASAININVFDSLDYNLDLNSVKVIAYSHPLITEALPGNILKFRFDNIMLADSGSNEQASHGYVVYEIDPLPGRPNGTVIRNQADIYFDFNEAVETNKTFNTLISSIPNCNLVTGITGISNKNAELKLFPNPASDYFVLQGATMNSTFKMYDFIGKLVVEQKIVSVNHTVNTGNLQNGIYLIDVSDGNYRFTKKIIIEK